MGCIVLGITLSVALVLDVALGSPLSLLLSLLTGAWFAWFWFGVPVLRRRRFAQPSGPPG